MTFPFILGCDTLVVYQFEVTNRCASPVALHYTTPQLDTTVNIAAGATAMILERSQVNKGVEPYFTESDTVWWFKSMTATRDSAVTQRELRLVDAWVFSKKDKKTGLYTLELSDADF